MSLPCAVPVARCSRAARAQRGCFHRHGEVGSTSAVDGIVAVMFVLLLINWWDSRTVGTNLRSVGVGMRARAGAGGSERVAFVCW